MKKNEEVILVVLVFISILLIILLSFRFYEDYRTWLEHERRIKQPEGDVEAWMNIGMASKILNIPLPELMNVLNVSEKINPRISLDRFCMQYNQNCTNLLQKLNQLKKK